MGMIFPISLLYQVVYAGECDFSPPGAGRCQPNAYSGVTATSTGEIRVFCVKAAILAATFVGVFQSVLPHNHHEGG